MSLPTSTITQWRAVGYDSPDSGVSGSNGSWDHLGWTTLRDEVNDDLDALAKSQPAFTEVYVEERVVTTTEPKRIEWEASNAQSR